MWYTNTLVHFMLYNMINEHHSKFYISYVFFVNELINL